ncbi:MAG: hypothetical protein WBL02_04510 [Methanomethylovorans sp.]|nr:hypothetical protein [Methanomethylovorans sp.]
MTDFKKHLLSTDIFVALKDMISDCSTTVTAEKFDFYFIHRYVKIPCSLE